MIGKRNFNLSLVVGLALVSVIILIFLCSFVALPYDPDEMNIRSRFQTPSAEHLLGTDQFGRDILSRVMVSSRSALLVGILSVFSGAFVGLVIGSLAAMSPKSIQIVIMRFIDGLMAFPGILMALMLCAVFGKGGGNAVLAIAIFMVPIFARLSYSMILESRTKLYVKAARSYGVGTFRMVICYMMPAMLSRLITQISSSIGSAILTESSLSFLGLGIQPPSASWGMMLSEARQYVLTYPYLALAPGVVLAIAILGFNLIGDGLNDYFSRRASR